MALDPIVQALVNNSKTQGPTPSMAEGGVDLARANYAVMSRAGGESPPLASVVDREIPGPAGTIPVRIYTPEADEAEGGSLPVVVYYHGGGWTIGSVEGHDPVTRRLAHEAGAIVVSVDYRLAPENPFPAAVDDAFAALTWVAANAATFGGDPARIAVAGDSAGGNLSAVVTLMAREAGGPSLAHQVLIYPSVDARGGYPSHEENAEGPFLTKESMEWFFEQYAPADRTDWRVSPIAAPDLANLPPALVITAQFDPLRDEGAAYAAALRDAGNEVVLHNYETMPHVFVQMWGVLGAAKECFTEIGETLRKAFAAR